MEVEIVCCCDDARKFQDTLHFVIKEGVDIDITLKAKGVGNTVFCKEDLTIVNFGVQYTHRTIIREIFVENKGRKPQKLTWVRKVPSQNSNNAAKKDGAAGQTAAKVSFAGFGEGWGRVG